MTTEEAIDYLLDPIGKRELHDEAVKMAVDALEKQIPEPAELKPAFVSDEGIVCYKRVCPDCGHEIEDEDICQNCGKWIRWDE